MSSITIKPAPIRKTLIVKADQAHAFSVFVARMGRWWPRQKTIGTSPQADVIVEARTGGRWYERGEDGSETLWGKVLAWEAPARLILAWQIDAKWQFDPDLCTEVEVNFTAVGAGETRVDFEHRCLERLGENAMAIREMLNSGWPGILELYRGVADSA